MTPEQPNRSRGTRRGWAMRRLIRVLVGGSVLALLVDTWLVEGLLAPVIVASGSMAPALLGPHRQWRCARCSHDFDCGLESLPAPGVAAVCPNCGAENDAEQGVDRHGDRVFVDRSAFLWRSPRRWEAVVFRCPDEPDTLCIKRVVGLPGERVQIQQGDVFVDGTIAQKDLALGRAMAVRVYDTPDLDQRWQPRSPGAWQAIGARFVHPGRIEKPGGKRYQRSRSPRVIDWLTYHHQQRFVGGERSGPILDESPCDQNESRELTAVADITLRCEIQATGTGTIVLRADARADEFVLRLDVVTGEGELLHNGRATALIAAPLDPFGGFARLELIVADRRVQLALNKSLLLEYDYQPADNPAPFAGSIEARSAEQPLAIGVQEAEVEIRHLQIFRDIYYTAGSAQATQTSFQLGPDEYFLLGDNSPHALDSRVWSPRGGLRGTLLVGSVLAW
jgi:signal peptidase I